MLADAGGTAKVIMEQTYDLTEPTVDLQLINLSKSGADVFYNISTGKASSQSIRKVAELGWKPLQLLSAGSTGRSILNAAGLENASGIVAIRYAKEVGVPALGKGSGRDGVRGAAQEVSAQRRSLTTPSPLPATARSATHGAKSCAAAATISPAPTC